MEYNYKRKGGLEQNCREESVVWYRITETKGEFGIKLQAKGWFGIGLQR